MQLKSGVGERRAEYILCTEESSHLAWEQPALRRYERYVKITMYVMDPVCHGPPACTLRVKCFTDDVQA